MPEDLKQIYIRSLDLAPERYEIWAGPVHNFSMTRRDWIRTLGGGLLISLSAAGQGGTGVAGREGTVLARLHLSPAGVVTLLTGKIEMGQGSRTLLTQAVAEELRIPTASVTVVMGDTGMTPDDGGTWGSLTTPQTVPAVRMAAAAARTVLLEEAARRWSVPVADVRLEGGIARSGGKTLSISDLASALAGSPSPHGKLTPVREWTTLGQPVRAVEGRAIVTGVHQYACDLARDNMWHGVVVRPPGVDARLIAFTPPANPQVRVVKDGSFLGFVAPTLTEARAAATQCKAQWSEMLLPDPGKLEEHFRKRAQPAVPNPGSRYPAVVQSGDVVKGFNAAATQHRSSYQLDYIAHVPLEPRSAIAEWEGDTLTVWCGVQAPFLARKELADAFRLPESKVRVISSDIGGAFGGKQRGDCALEAARLARDAGRPVKLAWTREDEFTGGYFRPAGVVDVRSGVSRESKLVAWDFHNYNSGASSLAPPYAIPHQSSVFHKSDSPLRQGSYRSLAAVANTFAREMHISELASQLEKDPLVFRLANLEDDRLRDVLQRAAESFGWGGSKPGKGSGEGLACNLEKDARMALFVSLAASGAKVKIRRMVMAFDAGPVLNRDHLRNQITGALIQGIGGALFERVEWNAGGVQTKRLSSYRVPRFEDVPEIEVILVDRREVDPVGAGESPITVVAPAIGAAIHSATGRWIRSLPMLPALAAS